MVTLLHWRLPTPLETGDTLHFLPLCLGSPLPRCSSEQLPSTDHLIHGFLSWWWDVGAHSLMLWSGLTRGWGTVKSDLGSGIPSVPSPLPGQSCFCFLVPLPICSGIPRAPSTGTVVPSALGGVSTVAQPSPLPCCFGIGPSSPRLGFPEKRSGACGCGALGLLLRVPPRLPPARSPRLARFHFHFSLPGCFPGDVCP